MYNESFASILKVTSRAQAPAEGHLYAVGAKGAYRPPSRIAPGSETKRPSPVPSPRGRPAATVTCRRDVAASPLSYLPLHLAPGQRHAHRQAQVRASRGRAC